MRPFDLYENWKFISPHKTNRRKYCTVWLCCRSVVPCCLLLQQSAWLSSPARPSVTAVMETFTDNSDGLQKSTGHVRSAVSTNKSSGQGVCFQVWQNPTDLKALWKVITESVANIAIRAPLYQMLFVRRKSSEQQQHCSTYSLTPDINYPDKE